MIKVQYRDMLRKPKSIFPIPDEGIEIVRREGNFYIYNERIDLYPKEDVRQTGTSPIENTNITSTVQVENIAVIPQNTPLISMVKPIDKEDLKYSPMKVIPSITPAPEALWEDYNLMPVYKVGEDDQFCSVWHQKGLRQRVYPIKKFRPDGTLELEGKYCRSCIEGFLKQDGHLE